MPPKLGAWQWLNAASFGMLFLALFGCVSQDKRQPPAAIITIKAWEPQAAAAEAKQAVETEGGMITFQSATDDHKFHELWFVIPSDRLPATLERLKPLAAGSIYCDLPEPGITSTSTAVKLTVEGEEVSWGYNPFAWYLHLVFFLLGPP